MPGKKAVFYKVCNFYHLFVSLLLQLKLDLHPLTYTHHSHTHTHAAGSGHVTARLQMPDPGSPGHGQLIIIKHSPQGFSEKVRCLVAVVLSQTQTHTQKYTHTHTHTQTHTHTHTHLT